jgi:hypothetical protein
MLKWFVTEDRLSTHELVLLLRRLGLAGSAGSLRVDVHRGLLTPTIAASHRSGRGVPARWTRRAVRRAVYIARLRRLGVDGRAIPLLAFLRDGWGWDHIQRHVGDAVRRGAAIDRRHVNRPSPIRSENDLIDNLEQFDWTGPDDQRSAALAFRKWLVSMVYQGAPVPGADPVPYVKALMADLVAAGILPPVEDTEEAAAALRIIAQKRVDLNLSSAAVPAWLETLDPDDVERGRRATRKLIWAVRIPMHRSLRLARAKTHPGSSNLLSFFGTKQLARWLRTQTGRPTPRLLLSELIATGMLVGRLWPGPLAEPFTD